MGKGQTVREEAYLAALDEDWDRMIEAYEGRNNVFVMSPVTDSDDSPFHLAVYSERDEPLHSLLRIFKTSPMLGNPCTKTNAFGNTVLHEAVFAGNMRAVELLLQFDPIEQDEYDPLKQLQTKNALGETPLYRAASCGRKEIVEYLVIKMKQILGGKLLDVHRQRESDSNSILHASIQGHHFETALTLLKRDPSLQALKDKQGRTCLHLLADMPSAFKSGYALPTISIGKLLYCCLSAANGDDDQSRSKIGWPMVERIRREKSKHGYALELAEELIKNNHRFWSQPAYGESTKDNIENHGQGGRGGQSEGQGGGRNPGEGGGRGGEGEGKRPPHPLFIATSNGIVEIAKEILDKLPQGIELVNEMEQNILHVAVMHRQREIFSFLKRRKILLARLSLRIDKTGYTLLHQVAHMKHYRGGTKPGPALQLQEEIKWFERVKKVVPSSLSEQRVKRVVPPYRTLQHDEDYKFTADELFQEEHKDQLKSAQDWIEKTSQSCSAVAVLVATVVFAAAFTIPGGSDNRGFPIFLNDNFFLAFTVLDVIALASSLTSVVMFLSILTTPFECKNFHHNIPRKLIWGFTLLFLSVMTTMLAFACTLFLIIRFKKLWTTGLISIAAFLPVLVFALMQFHLYVAFFDNLKDVFKEAKKSLPSFRCPFWFQCCRKGKTRRRKWAICKSICLLQ